MSHISEIKALYNRGDYQRARELSLKGMYECQEHAFLHSGTGLENTRDSELTEYHILKNRVSFHEIRDYFSHKTNQGWNREMLTRLHHFIHHVELIKNGNLQQLTAHIQQSPNSLFSSGYKKLISALDQDSIMTNLPPLIKWLESIPGVDKNKLAGLKNSSINIGPQTTQTPFANIMLVDKQHDTQMQFKL
ncbi:MAG: hypothetical protein Q7V63_04005 [Gammaproteobacteria bacterium]|nr:hypothetical protein [Gammaproteobacteria bacterium]